MNDGERVYLGIGSNIGNREQNIAGALKSLSEFVDNIVMSRLYETLPRYVIDQPEFLNCVVAGDTTQKPRELLQSIHTVERNEGRNRRTSGPMGPRPIDIDILLFGDRIWNDEELCIPHPRIHERKFVLLPLLEIAPRLRNPRTGIPFFRRFEAIEPQGIYYHSLEGFAYTWK